MNIMRVMFSALITVEVISFLYMVSQTYANRKQRTYYPLGALILLGTLITTVFVAYVRGNL